MKISIQEDMWEVARLLPEDQANQLFGALVAYGFTGAIPDMPKDAENMSWFIAFMSFKGRIEMSASASKFGEAGASKRKASKESVKEHAQDPSEGGLDRVDKDPSEGGLTTEIENEIEIENENEKEIDIKAAKVISHLNRVCKTNYKDSKSTRRFIDARLRAGYTVEEMQRVIDLKAKQWSKDQKMRRYLRPETLFNPTKFESYMQELELVDAEKRSFAAYDIAPSFEEAIA